VSCPNNIDSETLRKAILNALQYLEGVKHSAPMTPPERATIDRREDSLLQCLEHDPEHDSVAELIVYEYERLTDGN